MLGMSQNEPRCFGGHQAQSCPGDYLASNAKKGPEVPS